MDEVELLFTEILNCNRLDLYLNKNLPLGRDKSFLLSSALKRRICGEPIPYILGKTEFMGLEFKVTKDVFIPRPETEILVETAIKQSCVYRRPSSVLRCKILDLGTGSGNIAVSLAKFLPNIDITATDISEKAIEIAKQNAILNNVDDKIRFIQSDLFTEYAIPNTEYDIIISNPPYIPSQDIDNLQPEVRQEPRIALDGGKDGLDFYRKIIRQARYFLKKAGFLIFEMGFGQRDTIKNILQDEASFEIIEAIKDYNNIDRVMVAKWIN